MATRPRKPRDPHRERTHPAFTFLAGNIPRGMRPRLSGVPRNTHHWRFTINELPADVQQPMVSHLLSLARKVRQCVDAGLTQSAIAKRFHISTFDARLLAHIETEEHLRNGAPRATDLEIAALYATHLNIREVARRTRERPGLIRDALERQGIALLRSRHSGTQKPHPRLDEVLTLRHQRPYLSLEQLGNKLKLSRETVRKILRRAGIPGRGSPRRSAGK